MRLGFALPHVGPLASPSTIRSVAREAELLGYSSLWTLDRLIKPVNPKTPYPPAPDGQFEWQYDIVYEHLSVLTYVAAITERIRLGVSVLNLPFYQPTLLAKRIATLDQLSGGRVDVGMGAGWSEDEFAAANAPFTERGRMTEEYIRALKALWADDPVEFHGQWLDLAPAVFGPKPFQRPHPPLYIGGFAPAALRRGGRLADGFTGCCAPVGDLIHMRDQLVQAASEAGRDGGAMRSVIRCNILLSDEPVPDDARPVGHGTWEQIRGDAQALADAGIDEIFIDVSFEPSNKDEGALLGLVERFRGLVA